MAKRRRCPVVVSDDDEELQQKRSSSPPESSSPFQRVERDLALFSMEENLHSASDLWTEKYRPKSISDLAGNTKKIGQVQAWLESQLGNPMGSRSKVLLLTGPSGVGKKTIVRVVTESMNAELCEWAAPTPTLWEEHLHHNNTGTRYSSKLEEFESFLETSRKYPTLPAKPHGNSGKVLLVDDFPLVNSDEKRQQLCKLLRYLAAGGNFPTVIVFTDTAEEFHRGKSINRVTSDILQALEAGGAAKVSLNPVTANAMKRVLERLLKLEGYHLSGDEVTEVARVSAGDIRHATLLLQYRCLNQRRSVDRAPVKRRRSLSGKQQVSPDDDHRSSEQSNCGRDQVLSLFHALGKFLHNKRVVEGSSESDEQLCGPLQERFQRKPSQAENPELIISQSHAEASTLLAFFHENVLDFVDDESIEDAAEVLEYLSDADSIGARFCWQSRRALNDPEWINTSQLCESAAASVAARGVLFGNNHPAPRRWQTLRSPVVWQVDRSRASKKNEIFASLKESNRGAIVQATEYLPFQRSIYFFGATPKASSGVPIVECEDEIEDW